MGQAETKPQQTPQAGASPQQQSRGGSKVLPRSASSSGGSGSSIRPHSTSSTHVSSGSTAAPASTHGKLEGEAPPPCHSIPLQGVYLDLSSRCLTDLSEEPPSELLPFMQPPNLLAGEEAVLTVLESLSLAHNKLPSLEGLECVLHLPLLDAHDNLLELVDDDVLGMMANLERLNISKNKLTSLPNHFSFLQNLRELNLANNQLSELPAELGKLSKLLSLNVANNKLKELPQSLRKLHGLKKMIASNNYLTRFLELKSGDLPRLVWLDLSWNSIKDFPKLSVLASTLEKLYLEHNGLKTVDPLEIGQLKHLRELSLASNDLKALPQQISALRQHLAVLDISDNKFSQKEYQTQDVQALLLWLEDPKANPIHEIVREEPPASVYEQSTQYVEEGFFVEGYKNQLFRFKGKHNIRMQMMEAKCSSLNEGDSFILDIGRKLFVWFGPLSNERERAKAFYTGKALAAEELGGVPVILINEHDDKDFWEVLGGNNDIQTAEEGGDDAFWEQHWNDNKTLFKFSGEKGLDTIDGSESDFLGVMLNSNHAYVLHCGSTIFLWCGKESQSSQRSRALQKAEDLRQELHLQESDISWIIDGAETIYFKEQFVDWSDDSLWEMDYKDWPCVNPSRDTYRPPRRGTGVTMSPVKKPPAQADAISKEKEKEKEVVEQSLEQEPTPDSKKKKTRAALKAEKAGSANADEDEARKRIEEQEKQRREAEEQEREKEREREREQQRKEAAIKEEKEKELERERERQKEKQLQQEREQLRKEAERQQELERAKKEEAERENERRQREEEERQRLIEKQKEKQRQFEQEQQKEQEARDKAKEEQRKKERLEREEKERQEERARLEKERQKAKEEEEKRKKELERQRELEKQKEKEREREKERAREQEEKQKELEKQKLAKAEKEKIEREQQERKQKEERVKREKEEQERKKREGDAAEKQRELEKEKERQRQRSQEDTGSTIAVRSAIFNQPSPTSTDDQSISPRSGAPKFAVKVDKCTTCGKRVYLTEKITVENMPYHKSCFRCSHCNNVLKPGNYASLQGKLYCKPHFKQLFQLKGNYAGGFGQKKPEEVWLENKQSGGATDDAANNKVTSSDTTTTTTPTSVSPRTVMANPSPRDQPPPTLSKDQSSTLPSPRGALPQFSGAGSVIARRPTVGPVSSKESLDGERAVQTLRPKNSVLAAAAVFGGSKLSGGGSAIFLRRSEDKDKQKEEDDEPKQVAKEEEAEPIYDDAVVSLSKQFPDMGIERIQTAVDLFEKWDINKTGFLGKAQYLRLMQRVIGADRFAGGPMFQRLLELAFSHVDSAKRGKIDKAQFLRVYNEMFSNERRQTALLLTVEFPGMTVEQIEEGLKKFEEYTRNKGGDELIDIDEFYQLREELGPNVKKLAQKIFQQAHGQSTAKLDTNQFLSAYEELFDTRSPALAKDGKRKDKKEKKKERKEKKEKKTKKDRKEKKREQTTAVPTTETKAPTTANIKKSSPALPSGRKPDTIFEEFQNATELEDILRTFTELKLACGLESNAMGLSVMDHIRKKITLVNSEVLWQLLEHRKNQVEYRTGFENNPPRAVVVGSGPGGLRSAIELCLLGARVTVLEKRTEFSRNNLVHIWHSSIRDLKNIGTKFFYPKFCVGGINHIAIRTLQGVLLKIALLLGIRFLAATAFFKVHHLGSSGKVVVCNPPREFHWRVEASPVPTDKQLFNDFQPDDLLCDILIGADGENSVVAREMGFTRKVLQGGRAIGITANFKNTQTKEERRIREFGLLAVYNQGFFNELKQNYNIELENLVYYRGETHYFVMTAKTQSLVDRKVFKENEKEITRLLARENVDRSALELYVRDVATHIKLPSHCEFAVNPNGLNDVAIFDFSKKQQATKPYQIVGEEERRFLYVALVGDALIEPFWPLGTGVNRAILGALDSAWMIKGMFGERGDQVSAAQLKKMESAWLSDFKVMMNSSPEDLVGNFGLHTIDPKTRYKKNTLGHFH